MVVDQALSVQFLIDPEEKEHEAKVRKRDQGKKRERGKKAIADGTAKKADPH